jgi:hypothetical protein
MPGCKNIRRKVGKIISNACSKKILKRLNWAELDGILNSWALSLIYIDEKD